jgi:hypothetical protein
MASAAFAGYQIYTARLDANRRAALDLLRDIDRRVQTAWRGNLEDAQEKVIEYYRGSTSSLDDHAEAYMSLLNGLDLAGYAAKNNLVDRAYIDGHIRTLVSPEVIPLSFVRSFQVSCNNPEVYQDLYWYLGELLRATKQSAQ